MLDGARLYALTPDAPPAKIEQLVGAVLRGGADAVQLRHKTLARGPLLELAERLRTLTAGAGAVFIVNDHLDIALLAEADGVHLGDEDLTPDAARRLAGPRFLIGCSANSPQTARAAVSAGADHLGCGPVFTTPLKVGKAPIGPEGVLAVTAAVSVPVFAIGGLDASNLHLLTAAGLHRACVIRGLSDAADPESAARQLRALLA